LLHTSGPLQIELAATPTSFERIEELAPEDFMAAISSVSAEKGIAPEVIISALEGALASAYRGNYDAASPNFEVRIDRDTGRVRVVKPKTVVAEVQDRDEEISLNDAAKLDIDAEMGQTVVIDVTPDNFGRIAAQTARQVILQRLREAERDLIYEAFIDRQDELITGIVQRIEQRSVVINLGKAEAVLMPYEQVSTERYRPGQRLKIYLVEVLRTPKGPQLVISRTHTGLVKRLFELEVPEVSSGLVELKSIAREPGLRSKVAVAAREEGIDPIGSCVGVRGARVQNIVDELNGEKIDIIAWSETPEEFISAALSPSQVDSVRLDEELRTAIVSVPERQLSLAIGRDGQNARLAAKLTGWRIDIKSAESGTDDGPDAMEV
jgi:N utilization substance protein A